MQERAKMPRFFFNLNSQGNVSVDEVGTEFSSLEAAYLDVCNAILDIGFEKLRSRQDPAKDSFEIIDENRNVLMHVPFFEVLWPAATNIAPMSPDTIERIERWRNQATRCETLQVELRAEFEQAKNTYCDIRANLARIAHCSSW
jgi:hypothetical protein